MDHFGFDPSFFADKRLLDIGCGPRGSLEWARMSAMQLGLDPLADRYLELGIRRHRMSYVTAIAERMPLADESFDVISSFNSLDHVDRLIDVTAEIVRVLARGGVFLLLVDVNHEPTDSEPLRLGWNVLEDFAPDLEVVRQQHFEKVEGVYQSVLSGRTYDHDEGSDRPGVLSAVLRKPS